MSKIDELIKRYEYLSTDDDETDIFIKVKLKMIRSLFEEIKGSEDCIYMEEIISKFAEIMDRQHEMIMDDIMVAAAAEGYGPPQHNLVTASGEPVRIVSTPNSITPRLTPDDVPMDPDCDPEEDEPAQDIPSYLPPEEGFQTDDQVKKAFKNYLTYHAKRRSGKGFSTHTSFDYSSRVKVLMEIVCEEWASCNGDTWIPLNEQTLQAGCPFLNAYNNLYVLKEYVKRKEQALRDISLGLRQPMSAEEVKRNPLNNQRNLGNTTAALAKFEEFKNKIVNQ